MLSCSGLYVFGTFLKPLNISALPGCRPAAISAVLVRLSACPPCPPPCPCPPPPPSPTLQEHQQQRVVVSWLLNVQHLCMFIQGRICSNNCTCCHTEIELADQTFYPTQSQYADRTNQSQRGPYKARCLVTGI